MRLCLYARTVQKADEIYILGLLFTICQKKTSTVHVALEVTK